MPLAGRPEQSTARHGWRRWFLGVLTAAALLGAVLHFGEVENFARLVDRAQPLWLALAILFQLTTYVSVAGGWEFVLHDAASPRPFAKLVRIAVTKLFADQAVPSAGMGGNVLLVDQLTALGVERGTAVAALLVSMIGFYAAYAFLAVIMLVMLWSQNEATPLMALLVMIFLLVALAIPLIALWLRRRGRSGLYPRFERIAFVQTLLEAVAQAPSSLIANRGLLARVTICNSLVFLADAATLFVCLLALDQSAAFTTAFVALTMASIVVTLGPIPLGLGTFEATSTATLHLLGVPVEAAFAATMLLRLLTLWLPLLPGLYLMRYVLRGAS
ncbi:hypothetical protein AWL63_22995 (plasmid) [Sphingomonas panacis]|uniref:Lysylphosphatidylglycerol synthetase n=1 Tax=Sphingomonas panacis TaxID=1560345 RepID=A0A1B3ZIP1_9SPHN|nr:hypothetical protein AWL63_22995 [Sphingomonas panacis]